MSESGGVFVLLESCPLELLLSCDVTSEFFLLLSALGSGLCFQELSLDLVFGFFVPSGSFPV